MMFRNALPALALAGSLLATTASAQIGSIFCAGQPNSTGTTLRWAVLLMGRNSVSPCTTPSTTVRQQASTKVGSVGAVNAAGLLAEP